MERTKKFKRRYILFSALSFVCTVFPSVFFTIRALMSCELVVQKTALVGSVLVAIAGSLFCLISKGFTFRSKIWVFLLALYFAMQNIEQVILVFAITQILDEIALHPIAKHFHNKWIINKEIDARGEK